jgi:hypothetical protein
MITSHLFITIHAIEGQWVKGGAEGIIVIIYFIFFVKH